MYWYSRQGFFALNLCSQLLYAATGNLPTNLLFYKREGGFSSYAVVMLSNAGNQTFLVPCIHNMTSRHVAVFFIANCRTASF